MDTPTYIIGHKNPDADAICSAIAYAAYKEEIGQKGYVAARCGNSNARIDAILEKFDVPLPLFIGDVTPRAKDIMQRTAYSVRRNATCAEALAILDTYDIRSLPVVSDSMELVGQVSIFDLGEYFIPRPLSPKEMRQVYASVADIVRSINGEVVTGCTGDEIEDLYVRVGAMDVESFGRTATAVNIPPERSVIVVGDRLSIQRRAIEMRVKLIVVTGGLPVTEEIIAEAKAAGVSIAKAKMDSASTAWTIRAATRVDRIAGKKPSTFSPSDKLTNIRRKLIATPTLLNCVTDEDNRLLGVFTKSDLLKPVKTRIILVDHNELTQAVDGAGEVTITEVIDHHRLGNPPTQSPILFMNRPVGSTCTIIADLFRTRGITPTQSIAGIMMSGLISDTLLLQSPTTTPLDAEILEWLAPIAGIAPKELADLMFNAGSVLLTGTPFAAVKMDCKHYDEGLRSFSVSQIEEIGFTNFWPKAEQLLEALEQYRVQNSLYVSCLLITDINTQNSLLLVKGHHDFISAITYPRRAPDVFDLPGIVSRKKQLIPYLTGLLAPN